MVIHFNSEGRASGECDVDFASHEEATEGMKRDRGTMRESPLSSCVSSLTSDSLDDQ